MRFRCAIRVDLAWQFALRMAVNQRVATANTPHVASMNMLRMDRRMSSDHSVSQESGCVVRSKMALACMLGCSLACSHTQVDVGAHARPIALVWCGLNHARRRWSNKMCCTWPQSFYCCHNECQPSLPSTVCTSCVCVWCCVGDDGVCKCMSCMHHCNDGCGM
jgi:hypothetical protein